MNSQHFYEVKMIDLEETMVDQNIFFKNISKAKNNVMSDPLYWWS